MAKTDSTFRGLRAPIGTGRTPTLVASFLHFDLGFMLWVLLGALGIFIAEGAHLGPSERGLMVAIAVLSGSLLRIRSDS